MDKYIKEIENQYPIKLEPYFSNLINGNISRNLFLDTQLYFFHAVSYFSIPMFLLCTQLKSYSKRIKILENINDEHGNGDINKSHRRTYKKYLINLGISEDKINNNLIHPASKKFNDTLLNIVQNKGKLISISCLGMIEYRYAEISQILVETILKNNWLTKDNLVHYSLHEDLDQHHAELFFGLIRSDWSNKTSKNKIKAGIDLGNDLIVGIFNNLLI
jgi:pyrroloquinoline-quinone synthase